MIWTKFCVPIAPRCLNFDPQSHEIVGFYLPLNAAAIDDSVEIVANDSAIYSWGYSNEAFSAQSEPN